MTPSEAVEHLGEHGVHAYVHGPEHDFPGVRSRWALWIAGGAVEVRRQGRVFGYQDSFMIYRETALSPYIAKIPEPGQVGTESEHETLGDAVTWILQRKPTSDGNPDR